MGNPGSTGQPHREHVQHAWRPAQCLINNASTSYENLFIVDNREGDTSQDFNVELSLSENGTGSWLDIGGGDTVGGNGTGNSDLEPIAAGTYSDGSSLQKFGATVDTSGVSETLAALTTLTR